MQTNLFKTFPLREVAAEHALMEGSTHIGKIMLVAGESAE